MNRLVGPSPAIAAARIGIPRRALRLLAIALAAAALSLPCAHAQKRSPGPPAGPTDKQKAHDAEVRAYEKATEKAYQSTLKRIPEVKKDVDPWGNLRTAPSK